ncbi:MAG: hypothetical protein E7316_02410 [Clostridiales bacterium]|nr:hypothetical protein [Clostridiales bacterium]
MTFEILLGGGVTLPQLALKAGKGLKLTQEETRQLGKPLDKTSWDAKKLPYKPIDVDPMWYKHMRCKAEEPEAAWMNREALLQLLLEQGIPQRDFYAAHTELRNVNCCQPERREEIIRDIAAELGVQADVLRTKKPQKGQMEIMYLINKHEVEELMRRRNMNRLQLARAMWMHGEDERMPSRRMCTLWQKIEAGEPVTQRLADIMAGALGAEVCEFASIAIRTRKG